MRVSIFWKMTLNFSVLLLLIMGGGMYSLTVLKRATTNYSALLSHHQHLINDVRSMQVDFKWQVQEWKNILLRGHIPEDFEKYLKAFQDKFAQVQSEATAILTVDLSPEAHTLLEKFIAAHQTLQERYLHSLEILRSGETYDYHGADQHVRGHDRALAQLLDTLVEHIIEEARQRTQRLESQINRVKNWSTGLLFGVMVMFIIITLIIARKLSMPLREIRRLLKDVSSGNLNVYSDIHTADEIGDVARATRQMLDYLQEVATITEKIAHNEFDVTITPKSPHDTLNHSLIQMVTTLRTTFQELEAMIASSQRQSRIKDGLNDLNNTLSGESALAKVSMKALSFIARYVNAGHGVLYAYDAQRSILVLSGTFAFTEHDELAREYRLGQGIIGQVAHERSPIILTNIPRRKTEITTGTVSDAFRNTYTYPLLYDNELYGVMELATSTPLEDQHQNFLESANRVVATAVFSAIQREQLQKLYQARAE